MSSKLLLAHPTGNANVRAAARAFHGAEWLEELHSCICWNPLNPLAQFLPAAFAAQLTRRSFTDLPLALQHSYPMRELLRHLAPRLPWLRRHEKGPLSIDAVYRSFDRHVASRLTNLEGLQAVYAYEDGALQTFRSASRLKITKIYDLPIGYWREGRQIFEEERQLQPEWACTLTGLSDSPTKLARKDEELKLADLVVVPSEFVRSTLNKHNATKAPIAVIPFGSPPPLASPPSPRTSGPLRVLSVGSLGQRKGLSYALEAVTDLGSLVSLTLIGKPTSPKCHPLVEALESHHWIESLPHSEILEQMRKHDVLLLPSLFEGYALVISEALSQGLPVITTPNSGGTFSIRNGIEGFIVPIRDSQAIAEHLHYLSENPDHHAEMRKACLLRAAELGWSSYEKNLRLFVGRVFEANSDQ
jgi:glycosyltransferase involved in cell wall biosynthesis